MIDRLRPQLRRALFYATQWRIPLAFVALLFVPAPLYGLWAGLVGGFLLGLWLDAAEYAVLRLVERLGAWSAGIAWIDPATAGLAGAGPVPQGAPAPRNGCPDETGPQLLVHAPTDLEVSHAAAA